MKAAFPASLTEQLWFPDPGNAVAAGDFEGLVAFGGDLNPERLLLAYRGGIFPWTVEPITWWSPDPRGVFDLENPHWPRSLLREIRRGTFRVTFDQDFHGVIAGCAGQRRPGSWISRPFIDAYTRLHELGHAHSVECWRGERLAGGIYGVSTGGLFAGESMFHAESNASKVALYHLVEHLRKRKFALFVVQMVTDTTARLGATEISRREYLRRLRKAVVMARTF